MKPKLLIIELWGLGDLVIATPFLRAAAAKYAVTLVAKPYARDLQARLWPDVRVWTFVAPWTAFTGKYRLWRWPWRGMFRLGRAFVAERFEAGLSARWDPRDHFLLWLAGARKRLGFSRLRSQVFLTHPLERPDPRGHRYEYWRTLGRELGLDLPDREAIPISTALRQGWLLVHSGAGQAVRVWPLERYRRLTEYARRRGWQTVVVCDPDQRQWWLDHGERDIRTPTTVESLLQLIDGAAAFVGNDSGPGHLAAFCGVPTFTLFGPQLPEWFAPLHPRSEWMEGKSCPYKPCSDYCRFSQAFCLAGIGDEEVFARLDRFLAQWPDAQAVAATPADSPSAPTTVS